MPLYELQERDEPPLTQLCLHVFRPLERDEGEGVVVRRLRRLSLCRVCGGNIADYWSSTFAR